MSVGAIWAQAAGGVIGRDGRLPWSLPEDLRLFRETTLGATVVMGRRTWESLPAAAQPLPGRANVVLSTRPGWTAPGATVAGSLAGAVAGAAGDVWVIGGAAVYQAALPIADVLVVTELADAFEGDTYAPDVGPEWVPDDPDPAWLTSRTGLRYRTRRFARVGKPGCDGGHIEILERAVTSAAGLPMSHVNPGAVRTPERAAPGFINLTASGGAGPQHGVP